MITESKAAKKSAYAQSAESFGDLSTNAAAEQTGRQRLLKYKLRWGVALFCLAVWIVLTVFFIW